MHFIQPSDDDAKPDVISQLTSIVIRPVPVFQKTSGVNFWRRGMQGRKIRWRSSSSAFERECIGLDEETVWLVFLDQAIFSLYQLDSLAATQGAEIVTMKSRTGEKTGFGNVEDPMERERGSDQRFP